MLTEDHFMRMIGLAIAVLQRVMGLKQAGQYRQAQEAMDQMLEQLLGLKAGLIPRLDDEAILDALTTQEELDVPRLKVAADLFYELGEVQAAQGLGEEAAQNRTRALAFYTIAVLAEADSLPQEESTPQELTYSMDELEGKITTLARALEGRELPVDTLYSLADAYEALGRYALAEQGLLHISRQPGLEEEMQGDLADFYTRLLEQPDEDLARGGLPRAQVQAALEQLSRC